MQEASYAASCVFQLDELGWCWASPVVIVAIFIGAVFLDRSPTIHPLLAKKKFLTFL